MALDGRVDPERKSGFTHLVREVYVLTLQALSVIRVVCELLIWRGQLLKDLALYQQACTSNTVILEDGRGQLVGPEVLFLAVGLHYYRIPQQIDVLRTLCARAFIDHPISIYTNRRYTGGERNVHIHQLDDGVVLERRRVVVQEEDVLLPPVTLQREEVPDARVAGDVGRGGRLGRVVGYPVLPLPRHPLAGFLVSQIAFRVRLYDQNRRNFTEHGSPGAFAEFGFVFHTQITVHVVG